MFFEKRKPVRMCVICRTRFFQKDLIRLKVRDGRLALFDGFGRSFYLCGNCLSDDRIFQKICRIKQLTKDKDQIYLSIQEIRQNVR